MKAVYENDARKGQGYGRFRLSELPDETFVAFGQEGTRDKWGFALLRAGDQKSLHPQGWEDTACRLTPDLVEYNGEELLLAVSPHIVAQLDELNVYRLVLYPPLGMALKAALELRGIVYPADHGMGGISVPPKPLARPIPAPESVPTPPPVPEPAPAPEAQAPLVLAAVVPHASARGGVFRVLGVLLILLLASGIGGYMLLKDQEKSGAFEQDVEEPQAKTPLSPEQKAEETKSEETKPENMKPEEAKPENAKPEETKAEAAQPVEAAPAPAPPVAPLEQARQFLRGSGASADALSLSRSLPETPDGRDAAFLLLEAAAEQGLPEAMLDIGAFYDPAQALARGSIVPDPEQAWQWYGKAADAGHPDAAARRQALRAWLEAEAAKGVDYARDVLARLR